MFSTTTGCWPQAVPANQPIPISKLNPIADQDRRMFITLPLNGQSRIVTA
jgi:hypothetical protein